MHNAQHIQIGQRVSYSVGSDRYPAEVVSVSPSGHRIVIRDARVLRYSEQGVALVIEADPAGETHTYTRRRIGSRTLYQRAGWNHSGLDLEHGWRGFSDPSF